MVSPCSHVTSNYNSAQNAFIQHFELKLVLSNGLVLPASPILIMVISSWGKTESMATKIGVWSMNTPQIMPQHTSQVQRQIQM